jgi:hypothetical protein
MSETKNPSLVELMAEYQTANKFEEVNNLIETFLRISLAKRRGLIPQDGGKANLTLLLLQ